VLCQAFLICTVCNCNYATGGRNRGTIKLITNNTRKTKNNTCAMYDADPAIPPKPNAAAISAITKNVKAQLNIATPFPFLSKTVFETFLDRKITITHGVATFLPV
jgi:hypothetical protein